jgi:hypothetical protein
MLVIMVLRLVLSMMHAHLSVAENAQMFFEKNMIPSWTTIGSGF